MKTVFIFIIGFTTIMASCKPKNTNTQSSGNDTIPAAHKMVGDDIDEHGCKASAGYTWSGVLKECIRVWEKGVKMESLEDPNATSATFIVFNKDASQVELFIPNHEIHAVLDRMHPVNAPNTEVWSSDKASNGLKVYQNTDKLWVIEQDGKVQYREVLKK